MLSLPKVNLSICARGIILILVLVFFLLNRHMPLVATAGFEAANLFVLLFAPALCLASTLHKTDKGTLNFRLIFLEEMLWALGILAFFTFLLMYNGLFSDSCSPGAGFIPYFVTLIPPIVLNIAVGSLIATIFRPYWLRLIIFFVGYFLYYGWIVMAWWQETSFRILTHASLMISSDLLAGSALSIGMVAFRGATLLFAAAFILFGITFQTSSRTNVFKNVINHPIKNSFVIVLLIITASFIHWQSIKVIGKNHANLASDFSLAIAKNGIVVRANPEVISEEQAQEILHEALFYQNRIATLLEPRLSTPITIWLYPDDATKFTYTGAANVHFALPKHREIHLALTTIPHPVLGHELAHIYIGEYAHTVLGLPGRFGIVPNMALTEGLAMYLTPELALDNDLTMLEQAQAIHQAGVGINVKKLFSLNPTRFALNHPRSSYIFAGAFLEFVLNASTLSERAPLLKQLIADGTIDSVVPSSKDRDIFSEFNKKLEEPVQGYAILWAQRNYGGHSILGNNCQDPYRHEKAAFKRNSLNNNVVSLLASINALPESVQIALLNEEQNSLISEERYDLGLILINDLISRFKAHALELNNLWLNQSDALIHQNKGALALETLEKIDTNLVPKPVRRQIAIAKLVLAQKNFSSLSAAILRTTFAKSATLLSTASNLGFNLGLNSNKNSEYFIASYLYSRILMRDKEYASALPLIKELINAQELMPASLIEESYLMLAQTNYQLKNYFEAKEIYLNLLSSTNQPSNIVAINDALSRINYRLTVEQNK